MARPSPSGSVRLMEKTDTSVTRAMRNSARNVPISTTSATAIGSTGGEEAAEDEHEEHEGHGDHDGLAHGEVGLDLFGDGRGDGLASAHADLDRTADAGELLGDHGGRVADGAVGALEVDRGRVAGRPTCVAQPWSLVERPVRDTADATDSSAATASVRSGLAGGDDPGIVDVAVLGVDQQHDVGVTGARSSSSRNFRAR